MFNNQHAPNFTGDVGVERGATLFRKLCRDVWNFSPLDMIFPLVCCIRQRIEEITIESKNNKTIQCSECKAACGTEDLLTIDNRQVCRICLFGNGSPVTIYPIGIVNNNLERDNTRFGKKGADTVSKIELLPSQKRFMSGLDQEPEITIVYYLHKSRSVKTLFNRGLDGKRVGMFASRTPDRLSRIGIQDVSLLDIRDTILFVKGLDAINGTPVLDIKLKICL